MDIVFGILILIMSVVIHEVSHGYAALMLGDKTALYQGRLTLNPLHHLDPVGSILLPALLVISNAGFIIGWAKPVPYNPYNLRDQKWGEAKVAAAGPLSNIVIALFFGLLLRIGLAAGFFSVSDPAVSIIGLVVFINLILAAFNLIPIPPLDGSKILFAFLPSRFLNVRRSLEQMGFLLILLFLFIVLRPFFFAVSKLFELIVGFPL